MVRNRSEPFGTIFKVVSINIARNRSEPLWAKYNMRLTWYVDVSNILQLSLFVVRLPAKVKLPFNLKARPICEIPNNVLRFFPDCHFTCRPGWVSKAPGNFIYSPSPS